MRRTLEVCIVGSGGHASMPHESNNPILIASGLIREIGIYNAYAFDSGENTSMKAVFLDAGVKGNMIPEQAIVRFQFLADGEEVLKKVIEKFEEKTTLYIAACGGSAKIYEYKER
ncbi:MAG: peptidase dimerization domain-containing protein [Lachnospiraceae bacterium]